MQEIDACTTPWAVPAQLDCSVSRKSGECTQHTLDYAHQKAGCAYRMGQCAQNTRARAHHAGEYVQRTRHRSQHTRSCHNTLASIHDTRRLVRKSRFLVLTTHGAIPWPLHCSVSRNIVRAHTTRGWGYTKCQCARHSRWCAQRTRQRPQHTIQCAHHAR